MRIGCNYTSWGRHFHFQHTVHPLRHRCDDLSFMNAADRPFLPFGRGRSYGDSCLNDGGILLDTSRMDHFISFDSERGLLQCESGTRLADILALIVPKGWFLSVTPGTRHTTIGGAIANDVHGKNHHHAGTFGQYITRFELARSDQPRVVCSSDENPELFRATIGGLGLTGLVTWAEIQLKPIVSAAIDAEFIKFDSLDAFLKLSKESDKTHEYTVAWIDSLASRSKIGRGIFVRGNHSHRRAAPHALHQYKSARPLLRVPVDVPGFLLNKATVRLFNRLYYHRQTVKTRHARISVSDFFYPLDAVENWNRIYGKKGVFQCQFVLPVEKVDVLRGILEKVSVQGSGSFLAILKEFGMIRSPGILSFPIPGITLTLDFPNRGKETKVLLEQIGEIVMSHRGRFYPAKDSMMSASMFKVSYPQWETFQRFMDPKFSSSFLRRVT